MPKLLFEALCATLDELSAGFVAAFADGEILHANRAARDMMDAGWPIRLSGGCLQGHCRISSGVLAEGFRQVCAAGEGSRASGLCLDICLANMASPKGAAVATIKPLVCGNFAGRKTVAALFVTQIGSRDASSLSGIAECFGLTPAETRTLQHFVAGRTVAEVAHALVLSENTVKTHLQKIFAKTSSSRQPQLIKLVNGLRPPLRSAARTKVMPRSPGDGKIAPLTAPETREAIA